MRGAKRIELVSIGIFQRVLELRAADAVLDRNILHRLHKQGDSRHAGQFRLQAADHLAGADLALIERLQVDQNAPAIQGGVGSIDPDERGQAFDRRILQNDLAQLLLQCGHFRKRHRLRGLARCLG